VGSAPAFSHAYPLLIQKIVRFLMHHWSILCSKAHIRGRIQSDQPSLLCNLCLLVRCKQMLIVRIDLHTVRKTVCSSVVHEELVAGKLVACRHSLRLQRQVEVVNMVVVV
jgi:hypothetical protein